MAALFAFSGRERLWTAPAAIIALFSLGCLLGSVTDTTLKKAGTLPIETVIIRGTLDSEIFREQDRRIFTFRTKWLSSDEELYKRFNTSLRLIVNPQEFQLESGSDLVIAGRIQPYPEKRNPGGRNLRLEFARDGIVGWIKPDYVTLLTQPEPGFSVQNAIRNSLISLLPPREAGLLTGMLLGDKKSVPEDIKDNFRRSGLYHLMAVSGLHIGFLFAILTLLISPVIKSLVLRRIALLIGLWSYVLLTGASTPTLRAAIMISFLMISFFSRRIPSNWNLLGGAALLILLLSPMQMFKPGFQLSFTAMAGVLITLDVKRRIMLRENTAPRKLRRITDALQNYIALPLLTSACIVILTAPILIAHFGYFAVSSIVLNIIAIPLAGCIFGLAWCAILCKALFGLIIPPLNGALELGIRSLEQIAQFGAGMRINLLGQHVGFYLALTFALIFLGIVLAGSRRKRLILMVCVIPVVILVHGLLKPVNLHIECFDVGQGDALFFRFPGGSNLMVDCGSEKAAKYELLPSLQRRGINRINNLVITHFDSDHAGGAVEIMNSLVVARLLVSSQTPESRLGKALLENARVNDIPVRTLALGDTISGYPGAKCLVLWPYKANSGDENEESLVLKISYSDTDVLLTGDIGIAEEIKIAAAGYYLSSEILKVPHHGSRYSLSSRFLELVDPEYAFISCGLNNVYGHPHKSVIDFLSESVSSIHSTDINHAAVYISNGEHIWQDKWR